MNKFQRIVNGFKTTTKISNPRTQRRVRNSKNSLGAYYTHLYANVVKSEVVTLSLFVSHI